MKKLIVFNPDNAPTKIVSEILATWGILAELIDQKVTILPGCYLLWELELGDPAKKGNWYAFSRVKMAFKMEISGSGSEKERLYADVPITNVDDNLMIYGDGTAKLKCSRLSLDEIAEKVARNVSSGVDCDHPQRGKTMANWIPSLNTGEGK